MSRSLRQRAWLGHAVSVIVAYALAFQLIATSFVATQMAVAPPADAVALCAGHASDDGADTGKVRDHGGHATCLVCAFASSVPPLPEAATVFTFGAGVTASFPPISPAGIVAACRHEPRCSRGPPQTA